jgi:hypothetical protein
MPDLKRNPLPKVSMKPLQYALMQLHLLGQLINSMSHFIGRIERNAESAKVCDLLGTETKEITAIERIVSFIATRQKKRAFNARFLGQF